MAGLLWILLLVVLLLLLLLLLLNHCSGCRSSNNLLTRLHLKLSDRSLRKHLPSHYQLSVWSSHHLTTNHPNSSRWHLHPLHLHLLLLLLLHLLLLLWLHLLLWLMLLLLLLLLLHHHLSTGCDGCLRS